MMSKTNTGNRDMFRDIAAITQWLDRSNPDDQHEHSCRVLKIGEEIGEAQEVLAALPVAYGRAVSAYIGMVGQNPRKGVTHTPDDLCMELADVAITALCAMAHFTRTGIGTYSPDIVRRYLAEKISGIISRSNIAPLGEGNEPLFIESVIPSHIPAAYCARCARSGVGACDDFPNCPAGNRS